MDEPVLLTGAAGRVGTAIREGIGEAHEFRLLDREPPTGPVDHELYVGDITDRELLEDAMEDVAVVIHLAGDPRTDAPWESVLRNNIDGTQTVFEVAVEQDVQKVVFASSNHAVGHYETDRKPDIYRTEEEFRLDGTELPRPSNLYGVSKATGEILGRYYHDEYGISVLNVRIGNLTKEHPPRNYERGQAMWLSHRDCAHLFDRAIEAEYDYEIVYGISDNDRKYYSIERAREILEYDPQDNSAEYTFDGEPKTD
ncbi:NAD-dependent glucose-6-phosphate dehydrogenase Azf [Halodesulfurarchaeum sp. HSR-GB]|uniref:NAD-dependent glucose-6-phosphate dehydrogenase Azf n=1 Tax=Halodesulfurarchaeum sp. HSR-GB TaxID=3074077 RepID=UPI002864632C|nr:NAD-dependent glucose-6-phosphate dehydrogenase Azf [Halodesulfurarchaeum sp. HSR-GB]MDR5656463.1 NAD-dependent glucose-6-phosphate dehydrogenase Azf [Halodesulfurarchaeum sp. HSR-GB]